MEVLKHTPLSEVQALKQQLAEREQRIIELAKAKGEIEEKYLTLLESTALLYEENINLTNMNLSTMEAIAQLYEMMNNGGSTS